MARWPRRTSSSHGNARAVTLVTGGTFQRFFSIPQTADLNAPIVSQDTPGTILGTNIVDEIIKLRYANAGVRADALAMMPRLVLTLGGRLTTTPAMCDVQSPNRSRRPGDGEHDVQAALRHRVSRPSPYQAYSHYGSFISTDGGATFSSDYWHLPNRISSAAQEDRGGEHGPAAGRISICRPPPSTHGSPISSGRPIRTRRMRVLSRLAGRLYRLPGESRTRDDLRRHVSDGGDEIIHARSSVVGARRIERRGRRTYRKIRRREPAVGAMVPLQLRAGVDLDWDRWQVAPRLAMVGTQRLLATTVGRTGLSGARSTGYSTVDVNVRRRSLFAHLDAFVTVENVFDRRYRSVNERAYTNPEEFVGIPQTRDASPSDSSSECDDVADPEPIGVTRRARVCISRCSASWPLRRLARADEGAGPRECVIEIS